jgi:hypothetical protein
MLLQGEDELPTVIWTSEDRLVPSEAVLGKFTMNPFVDYLNCPRPPQDLDTTRTLGRRPDLPGLSLLDRTVGEAEVRILDTIVDTLRDLSKPIVVAALEDAAVHVWSCSDESRDETDTSAGLSVFVHGRASTLQCLRAL